MFHTSHFRSRSRRGSVLLVVLVVIALLALGAYSFSELMVSESHATGAFGREAQARACADSGIELAAAALSRPTEEGVIENVFHDATNPIMFGVRHVEPRDIHSRINHASEYFRRIRGRTNRGNNLCFSHRGFPKCLSAKSRKIFQSPGVIECLPGRM